MMEIGPLLTISDTHHTAELIGDSGHILKLDVLQLVDIEDMELTFHTAGAVVLADGDTVRLLILGMINWAVGKTLQHILIVIKDLIESLLLFLLRQRQVLY